MRRFRLLSIVLISTAFGQQGPPKREIPLADLLSRVAEEAEVLRQNAPKALTQETLEQRALLPPSRFKPRQGQTAVQKPQLRMQIREIVSEYSVGSLRDSEAHNLVEFRSVVSVDGRTIQSPDSARHALSLGVHSADDRIRKRMLEDFAKHGLVDIATDYGMILLAFSKRGLEQMKVAPAGEGLVGADPAWILAWKQTSDAAGELEFRGRRVERHPLQGFLWVRHDGLPLRVQAWVDNVEKDHRIRDEGTVDYVQSAHGFLMPASVIHRHIIDGQLLTENLYRYEPFKLFGADTEIKFTEVPDPPAAAPTAPAKK